MNSGACPQKGGAGSETGGACGRTRSNLDLLQPGDEEVPNVKPLPDSGDNDHSFRTPFGDASQEDAVMPLFQPDEGMEEPGRPDAAQAASPTAEAEKDAAQAPEPRAEAAEAKTEAEQHAAQAPEPRAEAAEAEKQRDEAQTGEAAAPSPAPSHGFETPPCVPPGQGYHVPENLKQMVLQAQCSVSLH